MSRHIATITDVAERHLCCGCGACAYAQPDQIRIVDDLSAGRRPEVHPDADTSRALSMCPGIHLEHPESPVGPIVEDLLDGWGPVLEVWEGHATDAELRFSGSSGGVASALALVGVTKKELGGTLQIRQRADVPLLNETVLSRSRDDVLRATGSRYAPASPCDGLQQVADSERPVVFIGKPCDVAATAKVRQIDSAIDEKFAVTIGIFCAGAPSTEGTAEMIRAMGIDDLARARDIRYRGNGWPGRATVQTADEPEQLRSMSYQESWGGVLQKHRPWRCSLCIDHTGEFADISVGDPWYRPVAPGEPGSSLVVVRTARGRRFLRAAMEAGHIELESVDPDLLPKSQPNLLSTRGSVWARLVASRMAGLPVPSYVNMPTFVHWSRELSVLQKIRSFTGTFKRIAIRRLHRRQPVVAVDEADISPR